MRALRAPGHRLPAAIVAVSALLLLGAWRADESPVLRFRPDDPLWVDSDMLVDASRVVPQELSQAYDFLENTFALKGDRRDVRAMNVNTLDEVPDSSWFKNRSRSGRLTMRTSCAGRTRSRPCTPRPGRSWPARTPACSPGFRAVITGADDTQLYQLELDPATRTPQLATGAE